MTNIMPNTKPMCKYTKPMCKYTKVVCKVDSNTRYSFKQCLVYVIYYIESDSFQSSLICDERKW